MVDRTKYLVVLGELKNVLREIGSVLPNNLRANLEELIIWVNDEDEKIYNACWDKESKIQNLIEFSEALKY